MPDPSAQLVHVDLGNRSYDIEIAPGSLRQLGAFLAVRTDLTHAVVVTDDRVGPRFVPTAETALRAVGARVDVLIVPSGEKSKSLVQAERLWNSLIECGADRETTVIALGGGVVGDLAGFVAATFARGVPFAQVPTTLLAQVDSSVGGKVGVNLPSAKNMVGAIWQPIGVLIDTDVLQSLPQREYAAGLAEVVKYGVILDADFFSYLETHRVELCARDGNVLQHVIARSCELKAQIVAQDERDESGVRAVLNYGHTFGHALETTTGYGQFLHGEAVAIGMMQAARLAEEMHRVGTEFVARQRALLSALNLPVAASDVRPNEILAAMLHDKKTARGRMNFVLPSRIGAVDLVRDVSPDLVRAILTNEM